MNKVLSTLAAHNIILTTPEFLSLTLTKLLGQPINPEALNPLVLNQGDVYDELADDPDKFDELCRYEMFQEVEPDAKITTIIADIADNRYLSDEGITKKAGIDIGRSVLDFSTDMPLGDQKGMLHTETIIDPNTGRQYIVNMDAIEQGQAEVNLKSIGKALGSALLLGGVYGALKGDKGVLGKGVAPLAGIASIFMGAHGLKDMFIRDAKGNYIKTEQGTSAPKSSVVFEKKSSLRNKLNRGALKLTQGVTPVTLATIVPAVGTSLLSNYYEDRLKSGTAGTYRTPLEQKLDSAGSAAYIHPLLVGGGGIAGSHIGLHLADRLRKKLLSGGRK
jgi:hypothetical protein